MFFAQAVCSLLLLYQIKIRKVLFPWVLYVTVSMILHTAYNEWPPKMAQSLIRENFLDFAQSVRVIFRVKRNSLVFVMVWGAILQFFWYLWKLLYLESPQSLLRTFRGMHFLRETMRLTADVLMKVYKEFLMIAGCGLIIRCNVQFIAKEGGIIWSEEAEIWELAF